MKEPDYTLTITLVATPSEAFTAINNVTHWWTENLEGHSHTINDEFTVQFGEVHVSTQKLIEVIPDKKVVWLVTDSKLNFVENQHEWTNTRISFEIFCLEGKTHITFTHHGLVPACQCFNGCSNAWSQYIQQSLFSLITTGKGQPTPREDKTKTTKETKALAAD